MILSYFNIESFDPKKLFSLNAPAFVKHSKKLYPDINIRKIPFVKIPSSNLRIPDNKFFRKET